jgi:hypothetical protein
MKTMLLVSLLVAAPAALAQDSMSRIGGIMGGSGSGAAPGANYRLPPGTRASAPRPMVALPREPGPYRVVNGITNDVSAAPGWKDITGKITQVLDEGLLVMLNESTTLVLVKNKPGKFFEGDSVYGDGLEVGKFSYITVLGAKSTVRVYDQGKSCGGESDPAWRLYQSTVGAAKTRLAEDAAHRAHAAQYANDVRQLKMAAWDRERAERGEASGQYDLGMRYLAGRGVTNSPALAREWLTKAAAQGHAKAKLELSKIPPSK